ncbi:MAG TPA: hypothetical protein VFH48_41295, partial [Chloroflexota bacterium]|nr:hypothetical protein [Chloroflexota bacterium]
PTASALVRRHLVTAARSPTNRVRVRPGANDIQVNIQVSLPGGNLVESAPNLSPLRSLCQCL